MDERLIDLAKKLAEINNLQYSDFRHTVALRENDIHEGYKNQALGLGSAAMTATLGAAAMLVTASASPVVFAATLAAGAIFTGAAAYKLLMMNVSDHYKEALQQLGSEMATQKGDSLSARSNAMVTTLWGKLRASFPKLSDSGPAMSMRLTDGSNQIRLNYNQTFLERESGDKSIPMTSAGLDSMRSVVASNGAAMLQRVRDAILVLKGSADINSKEATIAPVQVRTAMRAAEGNTTKFMTAAILHDVRAQQQRLQTSNSERPGQS